MNALLWKGGRFIYAFGFCETVACFAFDLFGQLFWIRFVNKEREYELSFEGNYLSSIMNMFWIPSLHFLCIMLPVKFQGRWAGKGHRNLEITVRNESAMSRPSRGYAGRRTFTVRDRVISRRDLQRYGDSHSSVEVWGKTATGVRLAAWALSQASLTHSLWKLYLPR